MLVVNRRDPNSIETIKGKLASLGLRDEIDYKVKYKIHRGKAMVELRIGHNAIMRIEELRESVLRKLCEMLNQVEDKMRKEKITKAIMRLIQAPMGIISCM